MLGKSVLADRTSEARQEDVKPALPSPSSWGSVTFLSLNSFMLNGKNHTILPVELLEGNV